MAMLRRSAAVTLTRLLHTTAAAGRRTSSPHLTAAPASSSTRLRSIFPVQWFYSDGAVRSEKFDLSDPETKRRVLNRLLYRSKQRGFLELDLVLGKWVEQNIGSMDEAGIKNLVQILDLETPDLWKWLTSQEPPPEAVFSAIQEKVTKNLDSFAAPETRAIPGQPWVRGWDDFKRGRDSPITGNQ
ncbi:Succinate dehydrogenase assembly factor 2, mitochondrial-like protein [Drosera capensis]